MKKVEIKVRCKGSIELPLSELHILQEDGDFKLKTLSFDDFIKYKTSIEENGFWFPFFVWHDKTENKWYTTDGTQRKKVLIWMQGKIKDKKYRELFESEDKEYILPDKFPCVEIQAENKQEAAKAILLQSSNYGKITHDGLLGYLEKYDLEYENLKSTIDLYDIDLFGEKINLPSEYQEEPDLNMNIIVTLEMSEDVYFNIQDKIKELKIHGVTINIS